MVAALRVPVGSLQSISTRVRLLAVSTFGFGVLPPFLLLFVWPDFALHEVLVNVFDLPLIVDLHFVQPALQPLNL